MTEAPGAFSLIAHEDLPEPSPVHIDGVPQGDYYITAQARTASGAVLFGFERVTVGSGINKVKLAMRHGFALPGLVSTDEPRLAPPSGIKVELRSTTLSPEVGPAAVAEDGRFELTEVFPQEYYARVSEMGTGWAVTQVQYGDQVASGGRLSLKTLSVDRKLKIVVTGRVASVNGQVTDDNGAPLPGRRVALLPDPVPERPDRFFLRFMNATDTGRFTFSSLPPGRYKLVIVPADRAKAELDLSILEELATLAEAIELAPGEVVSRHEVVKIIHLG